MDKKKDLQQFLMGKINEIDQHMASENEDITKLRMATMRTTYAKMMENFLKTQDELPKSHLEQAKIYLKNNKIQQAICQAQQAKRKNSLLTKDQIVQKMSENIDLLLVECYLQSKKNEDALSIIEETEIKSEENMEKYFTLKGKIYQAFNNQIKAKQNYDLLHELVIKKYGQGSLEDGLCMIEMGKNLGYFKHHKLGISLINQGMDILISRRYHSPANVAEIYQTLAELNKQIEDYEKEYSSLICAHSMIKQLEDNQQKRTIEVMNRLATNLIKREDKQKALEFLMQVQQIERKIYGQSSVSLAKTVNKIIALLSELNRQSELRKYENEYEHLIGGMSRVSPNTLSNSLSYNRTATGPSSIKRLKGQVGSNSRVGSANGAISRVLG